MNWGYGIAFFIGAFMVFILSLVFQCVNTSVDLTSVDYYQQEIEYNEHVQKLQNVDQEGIQVECKQVKDSLVITFLNLNETPVGTLHLYRPSDASKDQLHALAVDANGQQKIPLEGVLKGRYEVRLDWEANNRPYFAQRNLMLQ